ncbi:hypothetical protein NHP190003_01900 [Helicobacter sp. NHP19-003]|uniref:RecJ OB domain-containing protein n=1 Tax=Helicobacter gastrocanis TaxID=2849641 RepID=A0ABN6I024_9HELI|nr:single-stranded-DNA-specific exonuclease [Helicobacter sp. NHP19-003]BCZ16908.1 hypothetical protein NHP190003_01900 [Helicobacter sp. NHP19-003]
MTFKAPNLEVFFNPEFLELYARGEPYGVGNPTPLFEVCAPLKSWRFLGRTEQHIELILEDATALLVCKWWFCPQKLHPHLRPPNLLNLVGEFDPHSKELKCLEIKV